MRIAVGDIGRIAHDHIEPLPMQRLQPAALTKLDIADAIARRIGARHVQCILAQVHGHHLCARAFLRDGKGNRTTAGAKIGNTHGGTDRHARQRLFNQQLGLGAWNQCCWCHQQIQRPEALVAQQVGHRLANDSALQQGFEACQLGIAQPVIGMREQPAARAPHGMRQQDVGISRIDPLARMGQQRGHGGSGGGHRGMVAVTARSVNDSHR